MSSINTDPLAQSATWLPRREPEDQGLRKKSGKRIANRNPWAFATGLLLACAARAGLTERNPIIAAAHAASVRG